MLVEIIGTMYVLKKFISMVMELPENYWLLREVNFIMESHGCYGSLQLV
jgi:hypothetical protein